jgi:hypothetical protein
MGAGSSAEYLTYKKSALFPGKGNLESFFDPVPVDPHPELVVPHRLPGIILQSLLIVLDHFLSFTQKVLEVSHPAEGSELEKTGFMELGDSLEAVKSIRKILILIQIHSQTVFNSPWIVPDFFNFFFVW